jgi:hypothetical protein
LGCADPPLVYRLKITFKQSFDTTRTEQTLFQPVDFSLPFYENGRLGMDTI